MTVKTEAVGSRNAEALVGELPAHLSREVVTIATAAGKVSPNAVLGKITASGKYVPVNPTVDPADGSESAAAILYAGVDATGGDVKGVVLTKDSAWNASEIVWPAGISGPNKTTAIAQLKALGIVLR